MTNDNQPDEDIVLRLRAEAAFLTMNKRLAQMLEEAAKVIEWGRRRDEALTDTLNDIRKRYFELAVESAKRADTENFLPRRRKAKELSEDAKAKIRYIEAVLSYTGEAPLGQKVEDDDTNRLN